MIRFIAALDAQRGIATDSGIPWSLPGDKAYFREKTRWGAIVMGRATYDEFASPLHDRTNFVLTTATRPLRPGFVAVADLAHLRTALPEGDAWIIGGATVFRETIADADEMLLTQIMKDFHCTRFFPPYADAFTLESQSEDRTENGVSYRFETWRPRIPAPAGPLRAGPEEEPSS